MAESTPTTTSSRSGRDIPVQKPRWSFWKGLLVGAVVEVPAIAVAVYLASQLGFGDPGVGFMAILRLTTVFAGVAALFTAGNIGRLAAHVSMERGRRAAIIRAARAHAICSAGLALIAAIPHGSLPSTGWYWLVPPLCGVVMGALCGMLIGGVCSGTTTVGFAEVWSIARKPGETLKQLLDPDDFVRLGSALRNRTSTLFEGIFDPAPRPPSTATTTPSKSEPASPSTPASGKQERVTETRELPETRDIREPSPPSPIAERKDPAA